MELFYDNGRHKVIVLLCLLLDRLHFRGDNRPHQHGDNRPTPHINSGSFLSSAPGASGATYWRTKFVRQFRLLTSILIEESLAEWKIGASPKNWLQVELESALF
jgi:hypothetical protein